MPTKDYEDWMNARWENFGFKLTDPQQSTLKEYEDTISSATELEQLRGLSENEIKTTILNVEGRENIDNAVDWMNREIDSTKRSAAQKAQSKALAEELLRQRSTDRLVKEHTEPIALEAAKKTYEKKEEKRKLIGKKQDYRQKIYQKTQEIARLEEGLATYTPGSTEYKRDEKWLAQAEEKYREQLATYKERFEEEY